MEDQESIKKFKTEIIKYDVFINSAYIGPNAQANLLDLTVSEWSRVNIKGHVFTVGTTAEWNLQMSQTDYIKSKIALRQRCLEANQETGITGVKSTYLILGGINNGSPETRDYVDPMSIVQVIDWILGLSDRVGLIQLDNKK